MTFLKLASCLPRPIPGIVHENRTSSTSAGNKRQLPIHILNSIPICYSQSSYHIITSRTCLILNIDMTHFILPQIHANSFLCKMVVPNTWTRSGPTLSLGERCSGLGPRAGMSCYSLTREVSCYYLTPVYDTSSLANYKLVNTNGLFMIGFRFEFSAI